MKTKLSSGQLIGICLGGWAAVGHLLPQPLRAIGVLVLLKLMWLFAV